MDQDTFELFPKRDYSPRYLIAHGDSGWYWIWRTDDDPDETSTPWPTKAQALRSAAQDVGASTPATADLAYRLYQAADAEGGPEIVDTSEVEAPLEVAIDAARTDDEKHALMTDMVRWEFSYYSEWRAKERGEAFDRWLVAERARIWDEAYEWCSDLFAMPHPNRNPYQDQS